MAKAKAETKEYLLAHGNYKIGGKNPITYKQGDVIESDIDLVAKHGSKFEYYNLAEATSGGVVVVNGPTMVPSSEDESRFDVLDADGNAINERSMTRNQAAKAIGDLIASEFDEDEEGGGSDAGGEESEGNE